MVKWTAHATVQLHHIHDYIAQDSPLYAKRVSDALVRKTFLLDELPRLGRKVPELDDEAVRELSLYSYRILKAGFTGGGDSERAVATALIHRIPESVSLLPDYLARPLSIPSCVGARPSVSPDPLLPLEAGAHTTAAVA